VHEFRASAAGRASLRILALLAALLPSCRVSEVEAPVPRLVILYATCSLSRHYLSPYAPDVRYTPELDRFARDAVVFASHHTEAGQSGVAFASLFTGVQAAQHGIFAHPKGLPENLTLIDEAFAAGGYETFAWLQHVMASPRLGFVQGVPEQRLGAGMLTGEDPMFREVLDRLQSDPDYRAFLIANFSVTHAPYGKDAKGRPKTQVLEEFCGAFPTECGAREDSQKFERYRNIYWGATHRLSDDFDATVRELGLTPREGEELIGVIELLYKAGVYELDALFGGVVEAIESRGLSDESAIAFTSDHGEILYRDNAFFHWTHGYQQAPEVIGVPMLLRAPGLPPRRFEHVTRSIDVYPTLAGLAGVPAPAVDGAGVDLTPAIRGGTSHRDLLAFSHSAVLPYLAVPAVGRPGARRFGFFFPRRDPELMWVSVRSGDRFYKLRRLNGRDLTPAVYDLARDPGESENLFDPDDSTQAEMLDRLERYRRSLISGYEFWEGRAKGGLSNAEQLELLRSLGYVH
jgi:arylsulfatase A-like enzyme